MENEKLRILKMLEKKQITATEAAELLKALSGGGGGSTPPPVQQSGREFASHQEIASHSSTRASHDAKYSEYTPNTGKKEGGSSFGMEDLGKKFENFAKDMAPKVQGFTEVVADKISVAADKVSDFFSADHNKHTVPEGTSQSSRPSKPTKSTPTSSTKQISTELMVEKGGKNELDLSCVAGEIRVKGYNGDKITAKISYKTSRHGALIELMRLGGKYFLKYEADDFSSVSIDAYVPEKAFNVIKIEGINCDVDISSLSSEQIRISNMNGGLNLSGITANNISAEGSGGRFIVSKIVSDSAKFENLNGILDASELDISELKLSNYNAGLNLLISKFERYSNYMWGIETGNAKLSINLPTLHDTGYHIKAHAAMSEIKLGLTGLQFLVHEPSLVEARSVNFDRSAKKVKMAVETSNAPLVIN